MELNFQLHNDIILYVFYFYALIARYDLRFKKVVQLSQLLYCVFFCEILNKKK